MNQSRPPGTAPHPYTFRLPTKGVDPHYGLSRAWYYAAETKGLLNLIRLRERGKKRGVTLIDYNQVRTLIDSQRDN
jgi:hypothetical protein